MVQRWWVDGWINEWMDGWMGGGIVTSTAESDH